MSNPVSAGKHPAQFTPQIVDTIMGLIDPSLPVFDPFAGPGVRLGEACDRAGVEFGGCDLEPWPDAHPNVKVGDATDLFAYPSTPFQVVTSPTYGNGVNDHFEPREGSRRFTYRTARGEALAANNTGRYGLRGGPVQWSKYWRLNAEAVCRWAFEGAPAIVNTKAFIHGGRLVDLPAMWDVLMFAYGYGLRRRVEVECPGIRMGANSGLRVDHEVVAVYECRSFD